LIDSMLPSPPGPDLEPPPQLDPPIGRDPGWINHP
jgi:hypothetical protein